MDTKTTELVLAGHTIRRPAGARVGSRSVSFAFDDGCRFVLESDSRISWHWERVSAEEPELPDWLREAVEESNENTN